ncbi:MAG: zinc ribbon domain-containing protein [Acidobacteriota bacterium]
MQSKLYSIRDLKLDALLQELENFFRQQGHEVQVLPIAGGQVLQARKESTLSTLMGHSSALTVKITPEANGTRVEIGSSKWLDKAAVGVIGYVLMPVLVLVPVIGMYNQYRLGEDAWRIVDSYIARHHSGAAPAAAWSGSTATKNCSGCGATLSPQAAFCSSCGAKATTTPNCQKCGAANQSGARFCLACGTRLE